MRLHKGVKPPHKPKKTRRKLKPTAQIAHAANEATITDEHGLVIKRVLVSAEQPDRYGMVQCSYEDAPLTPYQMLVARNREERLLRKLHREASGLKSWKLEKPKE